jgi:hypothetical protein
VSPIVRISKSPSVSFTWRISDDCSSVGDCVGDSSSGAQLANVVFVLDNVGEGVDLRVSSSFIVYK